MYFLIMEKSKEISINLPVILREEEGYFVLSTTPESKRILGGHAFVCQGKNMEDVQKKFWVMVTMMCKYHLKRSNDLDKWKPFQKGNWKSIGGKWIKIFGLHFSFRYGKRGVMKHGRYIPFTKLNIMFSNAWTIKDL